MKKCSGKWNKASTALAKRAARWTFRSSAAMYRCTINRMGNRYFRRQSSALSACSNHLNISLQMHSKKREMSFTKSEKPKRNLLAANCSECCTERTKEKRRILIWKRKKSAKKNCSKRSKKE